MFDLLSPANLASLSYGLAAFAFFLLLFKIDRKHGSQQGWLLISCLLSCLWAAAISISAFQLNFSTLIVDSAEILRNASWIMLIMAFLGYWQRKQSPRRRYWIIPAFFLFLLVCNFYLAQQPAEPHIISTYFTINVLARAAVALIGLVLLEQFYRHSPRENQWSIKYLCIGIGGILIYDFYLYSNALLMRQLNPDLWSARGLVNALAVTMIALSLSRKPKWNINLTLSHGMVLQSFTVLGASIYLLIMAAAGYWIRFFGGNWGSVLQVFFLFAAGVLLFALLFSGSLRARAKVFVGKNFFHYRYDYREEWLAFTRSLSNEQQDLNSRVIQAIAKLVESPAGCLWLLRQQREFQAVSHWNMPTSPHTLDPNSDLCLFLQHRQWVIDVPEYLANPQKYNQIQLPEWLCQQARIWLIVPLLHQRQLFGFVVLTQSRSRIHLNWEISDLLKIAGHQAASYLAQQQANQALTLARQFESFNRMSTFVVHDLKNLIAQLSLLVANAEKHRDNPEFQQDMIETLGLSVEKMRRMLEKLRNKEHTETLMPINLVEMLQQLVNSKKHSLPQPSLHCQPQNLYCLAHRSSLERVIGHLVQNAIEATPKTGLVSLSLSTQNSFALLEIRDTGHGMSDEFIRERLFQPFESTKSAGMGIGVFESQEYVHELGGKIEVLHNLPKGTIFRIWLPLHQPNKQGTTS